METPTKQAATPTAAATQADKICDQKFDEFLDTINPAAKDWKYIEFRCMIQDILGNEIYSRHGSDKMGDRTIFYCITIPGENEWVRQTTGNDDGLSKLELGCSEGNCDQERLSISLVNYSFPIPDGLNKSCLIKVYDSNLVDTLRVNDIVLVGGFVEPIEFEDDAELLTNKNSPHADPDSPEAVNGNNNNKNETATDSKPNYHRNNSNSNQAQKKTHEHLTSVLGTANGDDDDFEPAKDFPERLVPRIHVRSLKNLPHINPLLPAVLDSATIDLTRLRLARARLSTIISQLLGGDTLMTEYLILSLISKVHKRKETTTLGQLAMCFSGFKPEMKFLAEKLYEIISKITTHSHYIDLSVANLNNLRFTPEKDHENNKMIAGMLQLPHGLFLMLNETALTEGLLTGQGTSNLASLNQIIRHQKHQYNFKYHSVEIDTDLKILVVSEGKSILPVLITVPIEKNDVEAINNMRTACEAVNDFLSEELLNMLRYYITCLMNTAVFDIPEKISESMAADFVSWRKEDAENDRVVFSGEDFSTRVTLARYLTLSHGESILTRDIWQQVCQMETERLIRLGAARA